LERGILNAITILPILTLLLCEQSRFQFENSAATVTGASARQPSGDADPLLFLPPSSLEHREPASPACQRRRDITEVPTNDTARTSVQRAALYDDDGGMTR
jgi:hypothetical protein